MITNLASREITFTPVGPDELGPPPKGSLPGIATPANGAVVYAGRLTERLVGDPGHRSYIPGTGRARGLVSRLAYVYDTRDIPACLVAPCLSNHEGRLVEYNGFIDARSGSVMGGVGFPKGYDPDHPDAAPESASTTDYKRWLAALTAAGDDFRPLSPGESRPPHLISARRARAIGLHDEASGNPRARALAYLGYSDKARAASRGDHGLVYAVRITGVTVVPPSYGSCAGKPDVGSCVAQLQRHANHEINAFIDARTGDETYSSSFR